MLLTNTGKAYEWKLGEQPALLQGEVRFKNIRSVACGNFHTICVAGTSASVNYG